MGASNEDDRLGRFLWKLYRDQIAQEFRFHPNKDEILERLATSSFVLEEVDKWFDEAAYYTNLHWQNRFKELLEKAENENIRQVNFKVVQSIDDMVRRNGTED